MDIIKYDIYRGPNIGIYICANDRYILLPMGFARSKADKLSEYLGSQALFTSIANTRLIGALSVMNNRGILIPKTSYSAEYEFLKKETDLEVGVLDSKYTALGNLICANDRGAVVSPWFSQSDCAAISQVLDVEVCQKRVAGFYQTGAVMVANNGGSATHPETDQDDMKMFANVLGTRMEQSTINNGTPYVSSGILANNNNIIVGSLTTGPEIMMLTRAFLN